MPIEINIKSDFKELYKFLTESQEKCLPQVARTALARTMRGVRTETNKAVRSRLTLPAKVVNARLKIDKISTRRLTGKLTARDTPISLTRFNRTRQVRQGVSTKVLKSKRRTTIRHAFIGKGRGGTQLVFRRKRAASGQLVGRYPIEALFGPSVASQVRDPQFESNIRKFAIKRWAKEFEAAANFQFKVRNCGG